MYVPQTYVAQPTQIQNVNQFASFQIPPPHYSQTGPQGFQNYYAVNSTTVNPYGHNSSSVEGPKFTLEQINQQL